MEAAQIHAGVTHRVTEARLVVRCGQVGDVVVTEEVVVGGDCRGERGCHLGAESTVGVPVDVADPIAQLDDEVVSAAVDVGDDSIEEGKGLGTQLGVGHPTMVDIGDDGETEWPVHRRTVAQPTGPGQPRRPSPIGTGRLDGDQSDGRGWAP